MIAGGGVERHLDRQPARRALARFGGAMILCATSTNVCPGFSVSRVSHVASAAVASELRLQRLPTKSPTAPGPPSLSAATMIEIVTAVLTPGGMTGIGMPSACAVVTATSITTPMPISAPICCSACSAFIWQNAPSGSGGPDGGVVGALIGMSRRFVTKHVRSPGSTGSIATILVVLARTPCRRPAAA